MFLFSDWYSTYPRHGGDAMTDDNMTHRSFPICDFGCPSDLLKAIHNDASSSHKNCTRRKRINNKNQYIITMASVRFILALLFTAIAFLASGSVAFAPASQISRQTTHLNGLFDGEQERTALTRDSEPEEFFAT